MIELLPTRKMLSILKYLGVKYIYINQNNSDIYKFMAPLISCCLHFVSSEPVLSQCLCNVLPSQSSRGRYC